MSRPILICALAAAAAACDAHSRDQSDAGVAGSDSIPVVKSESPSLDRAHAWRVDGDPLMAIGAGGSRALAGDTLYEFTEIIGAQLLADGRVVIAVMGSSVLRFFDASGRFLHSTGRKGGGPGEFRQIMALYRMRGDTLAVNDNLTELDWFAPDGRSVRRGQSTRDEFAQLQTVALLNDGTYFGIKMSHHELSGRLVRRMLTLIRVEPATGAVDSVATLPGILETPRSPGQSPSQVAFTPNAHFAALGDSLITANSSTYELQVRSRDGEVRRIFRRAWAATEVGDRLKDEYRRYYVTRPLDGVQPPPPAMVRQREARMVSNPYTDSLPAFHRILVSQGGEIWVERYRPSSEFRTRWSVATQWSEETSEWDVFDRAGRWITTVNLPARFTLLDVRGDHMLGLTANDDEEEGVQVLRLFKP